LEALGFRDNVGYDNRGLSRLLGTISANEVETLLKDLRGQPAGWLAPAVPLTELPPPIRTISPLRVVEVIPDPSPQAAKEAPAEPPAAEKEQGVLRKISPDLAALTRQEAVGQPTRMEVILNYSPAGNDPLWRRELTAAAA